MQGKASNIVDNASYVCNAEETRETEAESACLCITCRDIMQIQVEEKRHGTWIKFDSGRNKLRATFRLIKERKRYRGAKRSDCCIDENDEMDERERKLRSCFSLLLFSRVRFPRIQTAQRIRGAVSARNRNIVRGRKMKGKLKFFSPYFYIDLISKDRNSRSSKFLFDILSFYGFYGSPIKILPLFSHFPFYSPSFFLSFFLIHILLNFTGKNRSRYRFNRTIFRRVAFH